MPYRRSLSDKEALRRERPWVFAGAAALAGVAGFINVCLLSFFHVPVSHMSGAVSRLSGDVAAVNLTDIKLILAILVAFVSGSMISGLVIGRKKLRPGRRYGVALIIEGGMLTLATYLLLRGNQAGVSMAAMACGVQNAMASSYYGLVIRTTHMTGIITDVGVMLGHWLRHRRIQVWKLMLLVTILAGFASGGVAGAVLLHGYGAAALALPAVGCLSMGAGYTVWLQMKGRSHELETVWKAE